MTGGHLGRELVGRQGNSKLLRRHLGGDARQALGPDGGGVCGSVGSGSQGPQGRHAQVERGRAGKWLGSHRQHLFALGNPGGRAHSEGMEDLSSEVGGRAKGQSGQGLGPGRATECGRHWDAPPTCP